MSNPVAHRATPPGPAPIRHFEFPPIDRRQLTNGLDLRVVRMSRLPVVSLRLFVRSGEAALPRERAGLAMLTADALEGGTKKRSGTELAAAFERIGARFDASSGWEGTTADLYCVADRLPEALELLAEAVREPEFPVAEVDRAREQQLAGLRQREMDPGALASDTALSRYYAGDVPYARPLDGSVDSVARLGRDDLVGYADANLRPAGGGLIVVGDVDAEEVRRLAERALGGWTGAPASVSDFAAVPATLARRALVVDRPGSVQSEIRVGHLGAGRLTPDFFPLSIANLVLGGMFTSRLNLNLRERNGFTYGVRSSYSMRRLPGPFEVSTSVANDVTAPAVREIFAEMEKLAADGPTDDEVSAARDFAAGIFGVQLETSSQIASRVSQLVVFGLADDYFHRYRDEMRAVTVEQVAAAARLHVRPSEAQVVVVGDAAEVGEPLRALGLGAFEVRQREGGSRASD